MKRLLVYAVSITCVIAIWQLVSSTFYSPVLFPGPVAVARRAVILLHEGQLQRDIVASLSRVLAGFALGSLAGVAVGFVIGGSTLIRTFLDPYVHFLRFITPIAWISPVMIWFGIGELSKVILITYTTTFAVMLSTSLGVTTIPRNRIRAAQACGASGWQVFRLVIAPSAITQILEGMRLAVGYSFMTVVPAEMLAAQSGLGYLIINSRLWLATDAIFVGILTLGCIGLVLDTAFRWIIYGYFKRYSAAL